MEIKVVDEFKVTGSLRMGGEQIDGVWTTTSGTACLISREVLEELLRTRKNYISLQKSFSNLQKMIAEGRLADGSAADKKELEQARHRVEELEKSLAGAESAITSLKVELETARKPDMSDIRALSAQARAMKRDRAFALTLSLAIKGFRNDRIVQELGENGYGTSKASIARALSVTKDGDKERIMGIMDLHPECFEGITEQEFEQWFSDRHEKLAKAARVRQENSSGAQGYCEAW
ncbi:MAG: hypothetical protein NC548_25245 [Lachnospiraceae bacterium]|nr:hypothetical protein [Lachnospiraceae bacterium]